jgi:hypothetical protein
MPDLCGALLTVMNAINNHFISRTEARTFEISNGIIHLRGDYIPGQYALIHGSRLNDRLFLLSDTEYTLDGAVDEPPFDGTAYVLSVPPGFVELCGEIKAYLEGAGKESPYASESVASLHSYTRATGKEGKPLTWEDVYAVRLNPWRRLFADIKV